jgi:ubiquinol-cytochrome c reductase cytochrome b/c1 subunit
MIVGVSVLHVWALHVVGQNNPDGIELRPGTDTVPFTAHATIKDIFGTVCFLVLFAWFVFYIPNYLGHADNYVPANPAVTPAEIVPEWYYLPFYAILRSIPDKLLGVIALFSAIIVLFFLPWLDTSRVRSARYRPIFAPCFWLFVIACIGLGWLGAKPPEGGYIILSRILTFYYFAFFLLVLPILGCVEKTRPLPHSKSEPVLNRRS